MQKDKISIIGQCFNEHEMLPIYYDAMCKVMDRMTEVDFELIFVDDNSRDDSLSIIKGMAEKDPRVKCISMSRNFGREACAMAGFQYATGTMITTMDLDLQDPPEMLIDMYHVIKDEHYDIAAARAMTRHGYSAVHKFCTSCFFGITNRISSVKMLDGQREYRLMTRQAVNAILEHQETLLFNKGLLNDIGFRVKWIEYENQERVAGDTKFPYKRMMKYAINGIIDYSVFPLNFILFFGMAMLSLTALLLLAALILTLSGSGASLTGLLIASGVLALSGIQTTFMGILALYVAHIHIEVKHRPRFIVRETVNLPIDQPR